MGLVIWYEINWNAMHKHTQTHIYTFGKCEFAKKAKLINSCESLQMAADVCTLYINWYATKDKKNENEKEMKE